MADGGGACMLIMVLFHESILFSMSILSHFESRVYIRIFNVHANLS